MTWTFRRTLVGLGVALLLGVASVVAHFVGEHRQQQLIDQGRRVSGVVTDHHDSRRWVDWSEVTYQIDGVRHHSRIYAPWGPPPETGTAVVVFVDPADPSSVVTADGYATGIASALPMYLAMFAGLAVFVALAGWLTTARRRRWDKVDLEPEPAQAAVGSRRRGVVRRVDVWSWVIFGLLAVGTPLGVWANWGDRTAPFYAIVALFTAGMVGMYLAGMAGKIVVTARRLTVYQIFTVHAVPRHLVESVVLADDGVLELTVRDASPIRVPTGAASLWGDGLNRRPAQLRAANRLRRLLVAVPAVDGDGTVTRTYRWFTIALAVLAAAGFVWPITVVS